MPWSMPTTDPAAIVWPVDDDDEEEEEEHVDVEESLRFHSNANEDTDTTWFRRWRC